MTKTNDSMVQFVRADGSEFDEDPGRYARLLSAIVHESPPRSALPPEIEEPTELRRNLVALFDGDHESVSRWVTDICQAESSLDALRALKERAKELKAAARTPGTENVSTLLYHAVLAAAYAYHGEWISSVSMESRLPLYDSISIALSGDELGNVFHDAIGRASREGRFDA